MSDALNPAPQTAYRLAIAARTVLAIFGSYLFAALAAASLSLLLPGPRAQAVQSATMLAFALYCAMAIWAFSAASAIRAWLVALACCVPPALHLLLREVMP